MQVHVVDHPLAAVELTRLRDERTDQAGFRAALGRLSHHLVYEASRDIDVHPVDVVTPMGPASGVELATGPGLPLLVPILRAGLGMLDAALAVLSGADTGFIGLRRDEETLQPDVYLNSVPEALDGQPAFVLDPMLATAGSAIHACRALREAGAGTITVICVLSAPEGIEALERSGTADVHITAAVDSHLNEIGYIVPGLGDAGDRQFGVG